MPVESVYIGKEVNSLSIALVHQHVLRYIVLQLLRFVFIDNIVVGKVPSLSRHCTYFLVKHFLCISLIKKFLNSALILGVQLGVFPEPMRQRLKPLFSNVPIIRQIRDLGLEGDIHLIMSLTYLHRLFPYINRLSYLRLNTVANCLPRLHLFQSSKTAPLAHPDSHQHEQDWKGRTPQ